MQQALPQCRRIVGIVHMLREQQHCRPQRIEAQDAHPPKPHLNQLVLARTPHQALRELGKQDKRNDVGDGQQRLRQPTDNQCHPRWAQHRYLLRIGSLAAGRRIACRRRDRCRSLLRCCCIRSICA